MTAPKRRVHHVNCRLLGHAWDYTTVLREGPFYVQEMACMRCGTVRRQKIHARTGEPHGNSYQYVADYRVPGGMTRQDKSRLRLGVFREHFNAEAARIAKETNE